MTESSSREAILARIRAGKPAPTPHPSVKCYNIPGDPVSNFIEKLKAADGVALSFESRADAIEWLVGNIDGEKVIFSAVDDYPGNLALEKISDPHAANIIDVCVAEGVIGVGETGSVWVDNESLKVAAAALFSTDLYLLLDHREVVDGLHEAYRRVNLGSRQYGAFYTGPSATADIEAVHVTGAQGEISLTVLLY